MDDPFEEIKKLSVKNKYRGINYGDGLMYVHIESDNTMLISIPNWEGRSDDDIKLTLSRDNNEDVAVITIKRKI